METIRGGVRPQTVGFDKFLGNCLTRFVGRGNAVLVLCAGSCVGEANALKHLCNETKSIGRNLRYIICIDPYHGNDHGHQKQKEMLIVARQKVERACSEVRDGNEPLSVCYFTNTTIGESKKAYDLAHAWLLEHPDIVVGLAMSLNHQWDYSGMLSTVIRSWFTFFGAVDARLSGESVPLELAYVDKDVHNESMTLLSWAEDAKAKLQEKATNSTSRELLEFYTLPGHWQCERETTQ